MQIGDEQVLQLGTPLLRECASEVGDVYDEVLRRDSSRLQRALAEFRRVKGFGRAIAAPQIGISRRFIAMDLGRGPFVVINPLITWRCNETFTLWDDCMSFPELLVRVRRHSSISLTYLDGDGNRQDLIELEPDEAELFQHEIDHLDGILAVDRAENSSDLVTRSAYSMSSDYFDSLVERPRAIAPLK